MGQQTLQKFSFNLQSIPDGREGIRATLKAMSTFVRRFKTNPLIMTLTRRIVLPVQGEEWAAEAEAVLNFVRKTVRYTRDVRGVETVQDPVTTLKFRTGDCDDMATLLAAMLESIGHPTRFVAIGFAPNQFCHVYAETKVGNRWIAMEATKPWPLGKAPANVADRMEQHN